MSNTASRIRSLSEEIYPVFGTEPEDGSDIDATLQSLPSLALALRDGLATLAQILHEHAVEGGTVEAVYQCSGQAGTLMDSLNEAYQVFRTEHEQELRRIEEPRPGENTWNVPGGGHGFIQPRAKEMAGWLAGRGAGRNRGPGQWASG